MSAPLAAGDSGRRRHVGALAVSLAMDGLGAVAFAATLVLIANRPPAVTRGNGFFADPLPAVTLLGAATLVVGAGAVAVVSLVREPLQNRRGRRAIRIGIFNAVLIPFLGVINGAFSLAGNPLPEGWGQPLVPLWIASGVASILLGLLSGEPDHRGALLVPALIGIAALTFWLGELLSGH